MVGKAFFPKKNIKISLSFHKAKKKKTTVGKLDARATETTNIHHRSF